MEEIKIDNNTINTIKIIKEIFTYFDQKAEGLDPIISERHFEKDNYYEIIFSGLEGCTTLRLHVIKEYVTLVWLKFMGNTEIESDEFCIKKYSDYNIDRETFLTEFNTVKNQINKIVSEKPYIPHYIIMENHKKKMNQKNKEESLFQKIMKCFNIFSS